VAIFLSKKSLRQYRQKIIHYYVIGGDEAGSLKRSAEGDYNGNNKRFKQENRGGPGVEITIRILLQSKVWYLFYNSITLYYKYCGETIGLSSHRRHHYI
jgi:hypothetical protein